ncbi:MAG TPA: hypothetical protein H9697_05395 [Candidatus Mediterraneibacter faecavium]|uniref:Uncharacterized protein n=1 Tax=Candidatus Mediterraneibacter faecavium TaxID=2838668 RepID=A0A9D2TLF0_9FIRM|nr:hypothetical protein [Candidatus Mediterraneibacter faecavium]
MARTVAIGHQDYETVQNALDQIREKDYAREMIENGVPEERIRAYGFAFRGKEVLIEESETGAGNAENK